MIRTLIVKTRLSFCITENNYYILFMVMEYAIVPLLYLVKVFGNFKSRWEEDEADRNAVKNGYGKELIDTFKELSRDELINVYPHPIIEFLGYSHPGMYNRITTIQKERQKR